MALSLADHRIYLYRSKAKIEAMYEQLFPAKDATAGKLSVNLGVLTAEIGGTPAERTLSLEDKLRRVEKELRDQNAITSPDAPGQYVEGTMPMRWGFFDDQGRRPEEDAPYVFFGGFAQEGPLVVSLLGSSMHVTGMEGMTSTWSRSRTDVITRWFTAAVRDFDKPQLPPWWDPREEEDALIQGAAIALYYLRPPTQQLRFLARTMTIGKTRGSEHFLGVKDVCVIVGSPLWVFAEDPLPSPDQWGLDDEWKNFKPKSKSRD